MKIYNVALIGCGMMGAAHLDEIYYKENVKITYVCDTDKEKAELFQRKYGAENVISDYKACIGKKDVDIVICATYPSSHLDVLKECIKNGKHLICEKPIAKSLSEGEEFVSLVKQNPQIKVLVGHILRHNETYKKVAEMIRGGLVGSPLVMRMVQNHHIMNRDKYFNLLKDNSPIVDCGVHYIDVMRWFTGAEITKVSGIGIRTDEDVPENSYNYGLMTAKLSDGSVGYYEAGWSNTMAADNLKEFVGPRGRIKITYQKDRISHQEEGDLIEFYKYPEKTYEMINVLCSRKPTGKQFDCLIGMLEENLPAEPAIDDVFESFRVALMADEKIRGAI